MVDALKLTCPDHPFSEPVLHRTHDLVIAHKAYLTRPDTGQRSLQSKGINVGSRYLRKCLGMVQI